jgi:WD40 repeat protein
LSKILNGEGFLNNPSYVTFEFKVVDFGGGFIRTTLADYVKHVGATIEEGKPITLEYVPAIRPPVYEQSFNHDSWIVDVDLEAAAGCEPRCLTTCCDQIVRIWDRQGNVTAESPSEADGGMRMKPSTGKWVSPTRIAAAGFGTKILIFDCPGPGPTKSEKKGKIVPVFELDGHKWQVWDLTTHQPTNRILTASGDGHIGLWSGDLESNPEAAARIPKSNRPAAPKRHKPSLPQRGPLALIPVSKSQEAIHQAIFHPYDPSVAYTVGLDHDLHTVDLTTQKIVMTPLSGLDALTCIAPLAGNGSSSSSSSLLAVGTTSGCSVKIVDPRVSTASSPQQSAVMTLKGHGNRVSSVAGSPVADWALVSASWDSKCMVWDLRGRSTLSVPEAETAEGEEGLAAGGHAFRKWTIPREHLKGQKIVPFDSKNMVFKVRWHSEWGIVSCGQTGPQGKEGLLQINRVDLGMY